MKGCCVYKLLCTSNSEQWLSPGLIMQTKDTNRSDSACWPFFQMYLPCFHFILMDFPEEAHKDLTLVIILVGLGWDLGVEDFYTETGEIQPKYRN